MRLASLCVLLGCHHDHPVTPDAPDDAAPDATIPPPPALAVIEDGHAAVARWTFADAVVGHVSAITLFVHNLDTATTSPLALTTDSPEFAIDPASPCIGKTLAAADFCEVKLRFTPSAAGARSSKLRVAGAASPIELPLLGAGLPPTPGLEADVDGVDFGTVELGYTKDVIVKVSNTSTSTITLEVPEASPDFEVLGTSPATAILPGEYIEERIRFTPHANGPTGGVFVLRSSANDITVSLAGVGIRRVIVQPNVIDNHVLSVPPGIDCGAGATACDALFIGPVALTAEPVAGNPFAGWGVQCNIGCPSTWNIPCGTEPTCTLPPDRPQYESSNGLAAPLVVAFFASPEWRPVMLHVGSTPDGILSIGAPYQGSGSGAYIGGCSHDCTTYAPDNMSGSQIDAFASTPHGFAGWQGPCGTNRECPLGSGPVELTATFAPDDRAVTTLFPSFPTDKLAWLPDGDLVAAGGHVVTKLSPSGAVRWSVALPYTSASSPAIDLAASGDAIYYLRSDTVGIRGTAVLHKLDLHGVPQWSRALARRQRYESNSFGRSLAVGSSGDVAVLLYGDTPSLDVIGGDGTPRWSASVPGCRGIATAADGSYLVVVPDASILASEIRRYAADGTPLAPFGTIPGRFVGLAVGPSGDVAMHFNGADNGSTIDITLAKFLANGTPVFQRTVTLPSTLQTFEDGVAFDTGHIIAVRALSSNPFVGAHLERWTADGTSEWAIDKSWVLYTNPITGQDLFRAEAVATDGAGHVAIAGTYDSTGWIEIFAMP